jgi:hypothetical protein
MRNVHRILVGNPQGKTTEKLKCRWDSNIKIDVEDSGSENASRIHLAQDRDQWQDLVNTTMVANYSATINSPEDDCLLRRCVV